MPRHRFKEADSRKAVRFLLTPSPKYPMRKEKLTLVELPEEATAVASEHKRHGIPAKDFTVMFRDVMIHCKKDVRINSDPSLQDFLMANGLPVVWEINDD